MVNIIYCKSDSIKTDYMLKAIKQNTENGKKQLVFVPETKTFEMEKALLKSDRPSVFFEQMKRMNQLDFWFP